MFTDRYPGGQAGVPNNSDSHERRRFGTNTASCRVLLLAHKYNYKYNCNSTWLVDLQWDYHLYSRVPFHKACLPPTTSHILVHPRLYHSSPTPVPSHLSTFPLRTPFPDFNPPNAHRFLHSFHLCAADGGGPGGGA